MGVCGAELTAMIDRKLMSLCRGCYDDWWKVVKDLHTKQNLHLSSVAYWGNEIFLFRKPLQLCVPARRFTQEDKLLRSSAGQWQQTDNWSDVEIIPIRSFSLFHPFTKCHNIMYFHQHRFACDIKSFVTHCDMASIKTAALHGWVVDKHNSGMCYPISQMQWRL